MSEAPGRIYSCYSGGTDAIKRHASQMKTQAAGRAEIFGNVPRCRILPPHFSHGGGFSLVGCGVAISCMDLNVFSGVLPSYVRVWLGEPGQDLRLTNRPPWPVRIDGTGSHVASVCKLLGCKLLGEFFRGKCLRDPHVVMHGFAWIAVSDKPSLLNGHQFNLRNGGSVFLTKKAADFSTAGFVSG